MDVVRMARISLGTVMLSWLYPVHSYVTCHEDGSWTRLALASLGKLDGLFFVAQRYRNRTIQIPS